jgi:hypothetical protein
VDEIAGPGYLAMVTDPIPVTDALLRLESALVRRNSRSHGAA